MKKLLIFLAAMLAFTSTAYAEIGSLAADLVFTPVAPCRLFDTRPSQGGTGPIPAAGTKGFKVWGQTSFAAQGGSTTNCGVVAAANTAAVAVNFTVVMPTAGGFITAYPTGAAQPLAATVNFNAGDIKGNFAIVPVQQFGSGGNTLNVYSTSTVDVVGDVVGYYSKPVATAMECYTTSLENYVVPAGFHGFHVTTSLCAAGYSTVSSNCLSGVSGLSSGGSGITNQSAWCAWSNSTANSITVNQGATCCRIPGR